MRVHRSALVSTVVATCVAVCLPSAGVDAAGGASNIHFSASYNPSRITGWVGDNVAGTVTVDSYNKFTVCAYRMSIYGRGYLAGSPPATVSRRDEVGGSCQNYRPSRRIGTIWATMGGMNSGLVTVLR